MTAMLGGFSLRGDSPCIPQHQWEWAEIPQRDCSQNVLRGPGGAGANHHLETSWREDHQPPAQGDIARRSSHCIGQHTSTLCSHWLRSIALECHKDTVQGTQSPFYQGHFLPFPVSLLHKGASLWHKEASLAISEHRGSQNQSVGAVLQLGSVTRRDSGDYLCIARNNFPPAIVKQIRLNVMCEYKRGRTRDHQEEIS